MSLNIHKNIIEKIDYFIENKKIPHIIFFGPSGSGKRYVLNYLINNMYRSECENPIHLVVDTTLIGDSMNVRGFVNNSVTVNGEVLASSFQELKVDDAMSEGEASCLFHMINNQEGEQWSESSIVSSLPTAADTVEASILQLQKVLASAQAYVDAVVEGNPNEQNDPATTKHVGCAARQ